MFYSIGICLFTGSKTFTIFPLNLVLYPILRLFNMSIPVFSIEEAA